MLAVEFHRFFLLFERIIFVLLIDRGELRLQSGHALAGSRAGGGEGPENHFYGEGDRDDGPPIR